MTDRHPIEHDQSVEQAAAWLADGNGAALATVLRTWGSAPRQAGARLAISSEAELHGSVSGGCVESAVASEAMEAMQDGTPRVLEFGVSDEDAWSVGLACGMLLCAAQHAGLATLTHTPSPMNFLGQLLDRPAHERPYLLIPVGYPAADCVVPAAAVQRKQLDDIMVVR